MYSLSTVDPWWTSYVICLYDPNFEIKILRWNSLTIRLLNNSSSTQTNSLTKFKFLRFYRYIHILSVHTERVLWSALNKFELMFKLCRQNSIFKNTGNLISQFFDENKSIHTQDELSKFNEWRWRIHEN